MSNRFSGVALALAIAVPGIPSLLQAQGLNRQISGTITDTTGAVLPLLAGTFDLTVIMQGFKTYINNLFINGRTSFNFSYDGVTNKDEGQNGANYAAPALDSIAEIRGQHQCDLRLHDRGAHKCQHLRPAERQHAQRASHSARREVHVLIEVD